MSLPYLQIHINTIVIIAKIIIGGSIAITLLVTLISFVSRQSEKQQKKMPSMALVIGIELALILFNSLSWVQSSLSTWMPPIQSTFSTWMPPIPNSPYVAIARADAQTEGIDTNIYIRQINQESGFNPNAHSSAGAEGIAQFMPDTAADLGLNPWDPAQSLQGAAHYMSSLFHQYQDYAKALAAYNAGQGMVEQALTYSSDWLSHMPLETQNYVHVILAQG